MILQRYLFIILLLISFNSFSGQTILVVGDSLSASYGIDRSEGWVALLQQKIASQNLAYNVINTSISGETTHAGLSHLPQDLSTHQPNVVIIELGANDGLRGLSLSIMSKNLKDMIQRSQAIGAKVLLIGMRIPSNYGHQYTQRFKNIYTELADQFDLALVPFLFAGLEKNKSLFQRDGLHPTAKAQPILLNNVWLALKNML